MSMEELKQKMLADIAEFAAKKAFIERYEAKVRSSIGEGIRLDVIDDDPSDYSWTLDSGTVVEIARDENGAVVGIVASGSWPRADLPLVEITAADMDELITIWQEARS